MQRNKLPEGWKEVEFQDIAEFISGFAFSSSDYKNSGIKIIRIQNLGNNKDEKYVYWDKEYDEKYLIKKGDLLLSLSGTIPVSFKIYTWKDEPALLNQRILKIKLNEKLADKKYIAYAVFKELINIYSKATSTTGIANVSLGVVKSLKIILPPLSTQKHIVSILEKAESAKNMRKDADKLTKDYINSVFLEMFLGYFKDKKNLKKIDFFCQKYKNSIKAGPFGSSLKKEIYVKRGYKIYGQEQVIKNDLTFGDYYITKEKYKELENYKVAEGDILISLVGTYGKISIVPKNFEEGIINPRLMKITLDKTKMNPVFFKHLFLSSFIKSQLERVSHGGTMDIVNVGLIKNIGFPEILIPLQLKFSKIVEKVEKLKEYQKQSKEHIDNLFNALMQKAFKGELI